MCKSELAKLKKGFWNNNTKFQASFFPTCHFASAPSFACLCLSLAIIISFSSPPTLIHTLYTDLYSSLYEILCIILTFSDGWDKGSFSSERISLFKGRQIQTYGFSMKPVMVLFIFFLNIIPRFFT